jgi:hypothetical protein
MSEAKPSYRLAFRAAWSFFARSSLNPPNHAQELPHTVMACVFQWTGPTGPTTGQRDSAIEALKICDKITGEGAHSSPPISRGFIAYSGIGQGAGRRCGPFRVSQQFRYLLTQQLDRGDVEDQALQLNP